MPTLQEGEVRPGQIDPSLPQEPSQPALVERPVSTELGALEEGRQELAGFINPVAATDDTTDVRDEDGKTLLHGSTKEIKDLSLPDEVMKDEAPKWYDFNKHIGSAVIWLVEQVIRRDKKDAKQGE
jgi:hypothetical protein